MAQNSMDLFSLLPTSHNSTIPESSEAYHPSWPPNASTFPLCRASPVAPSPPTRTLPSATNASATRATGGRGHQRNVVDEAIATRTTTLAVLLGREGGGGRRSADVVLPGAFLARMDVLRAAATMDGAAMLSRWRLREQMLDGATRGGGGRREASSSLWRTTTMDGIFPRMPLSPPTEDGDGNGGKGGGGGVSGGLNQIRIRVKQVLSKFSGALQEILG
jgi:hypothetical protein